MSEKSEGCWYRLLPCSKARSVVGLVLLAVILRAMLVALVTASPGCDLESYVLGADGRQIVSMARGWQGDLDVVRREPFFESLVANGALSSSHLIRFLPALGGMLSAGLGAGLPLGWAGTIPFWVLAGISAAVTALWAGDLRAGLVVASLPPIQLYASSFPGYEPWFFLFCVSAFLAAERGRWVAAGALVGLAAWARPEALFAALGIAWLAGRTGGWRAVTRSTFAALGAGILGALLVAWRFAPLLGEFRGAADLTSEGMLRPAFVSWPGKALLDGTLDGSHPAWKIAYVLAHLVVALLVVATLVLRSGEPEATPVARRHALLVWVGAHLLFVVSLAGSQGYDDLPRYLGLVAPALAVAALPILPKSAWTWLAIVLLSLAVAYVPARKNTWPECRPVTVYRGTLDLPFSTLTPGGSTNAAT